MAKDTYFSLFFDKGSPKASKDCKTKDSQGNDVNADELTPISKFFELLDNGALTSIGSIYRGVINSATGEFLATSPDASITAGQCIIVYIGGTAYKICA